MDSTFIQTTSTCDNVCLIRSGWNRNWSDSYLKKLKIVPKSS